MYHPKMLQYRESLIFGNLKDNLALQYSSCGANLLFSVFTQLKSRILGFVPSYLPLGTERSN